MSMSIQNNLKRLTSIELRSLQPGHQSDTRASTWNEKRQDGVGGGKVLQKLKMKNQSQRQGFDLGKLQKMELVGLNIRQCGGYKNGNVTNCIQA